jgi:hypothetical protein
MDAIKISRFTSTYLYVYGHTSVCIKFYTILSHVSTTAGEILISSITRSPPVILTYYTHPSHLLTLHPLPTTNLLSISVILLFQECLINRTI